MRAFKLSEDEYIDDLQTAKSICRHCGEELNDDSYPEDDCALAPAKTSKEEQTEC